MLYQLTATVYIETSQRTSFVSAPLGTFAQLVDVAQSLCDRAASRGAAIVYTNRESHDAPTFPFLFATIMEADADCELRIVEHKNTL